MADATEKLKDLMVKLDRGLITREEFDPQTTAPISGDRTSHRIALEQRLQSASISRAGLTWRAS